MRYILFLLLSCLAYSCNQSKEVDLLEDHSITTGLAQQQSKGNYLYRSRYIPIADQISKAVDGAKKDSESFRKTIKETEGHHYIFFQIAPRNQGASLQQLYETSDRTTTWPNVQSAINFHYQKQFDLRSNNAAYACKIYQAFPGINAQGGIQFMAVFKDEAATVNQEFKEDLQFSFIDKHFSNDIIEFTFSKEDLNNIPTLQL